MRSWGFCAKWEAFAERACGVYAELFGMEARCLHSASKKLRKCRKWTVCVVDGIRSNYTVEIVIPAGSDSGPSGELWFPEDFPEVIAVLTGWQPAGFWFSKGDKSFHGNNFPSRSEKTS